MSPLSPNLRKRVSGFQIPWTKGELAAGLNYFKQLHGHYPSAHEIDDFEYLPSARSIQRAHGGLVSLRTELLPDEHSDHTRGVYRSDKARQTNVAGRDYESKFYQALIQRFEAVAVHEHRVIRPGYVSCDFYIYLTKDSGVIIDIFYASDMRNLVNVVNIKLKRYVLVAEPTYLVIVGNLAIDETVLTETMANKKLPLPYHLRVITERQFFDTVMPELVARSQFSL